MKKNKTKTSKARHQLQDPFLEREREKYANPLPSREFILMQLKKQPLTTQDLADLLGIKKKEMPFFLRRLRAMNREGQIYFNRQGAICLSGDKSAIRGQVLGHRDGYGFVRPSDESPDLYLNEREMRRVFHGDIVLVRERKMDKRGRREAEIIEILERAQSRVVGRLLWEDRLWWLIPEDKRLAQAILIDNPKREKKSKKLSAGKADFAVEDEKWRAEQVNLTLPADSLPPNPILSAGKDAFAGDIVCVHISQQPSDDEPAHAWIVERLGAADEAGMEIEIALRQHALPYLFSEAVLAEADNTPQEVTENWQKTMKNAAKIAKHAAKNPKNTIERQDLTHLPFVTIDGVDARDFDDAVFAQKDGKFWHLKVAIADVSHYVEPGSAMDTEAQARGNSVYFPRRVIPMLPEALSNGICSLNEGVRRLVLVCDMRFGARGALHDFCFYPAVICSRARLTYTEVWDFLALETQQADLQNLNMDFSGGQISDWARQNHQKIQNCPPEVAQNLLALYQVFQALFAARKRRGALELDTLETMMQFDHEGKIAAILPIKRNDAHRLIEEAMLAANVCAAKFLQAAHQPTLFRVHEAPAPEKLANLAEFLRLAGLRVDLDEDAEPKDFAQILDKIRSREDAAILQTALLRSMRQAVYHFENKGHFGLAYPEYVHFTSPIRRYPDLLVHRAILAVLAGETYTPSRSWLDLGEHFSMTERRADEASRDVESYLKTHFMQQHLGEVFAGKISAVTSFGVFVQLDEVFTEGLLHMSELGRDYFEFQAQAHRLVGEKTGIVYRLGDRVMVKVARVDLEQSRVDFALISHSPSKKKSKRR